MSARKSFLLRVDRDLLDQVQRWASDDFRSLNGQIEFLLRRALQGVGRMPKSDALPEDGVEASPFEHGDGDVGSGG